MIAMTLNVTAASDIFTQDIEDLPEELREHEPSQPATNPELTAKWVGQANAAQTSEALTDIWKEGVKEIQAVKDMPAYNAFKAAVEARGKALKAAEPQGEPAADDIPVDF
ncbi:hypothetical protein D9M71_727670 [compost metagenome]